jgi:hypothetical protein
VLFCVEKMLKALSPGKKAKPIHSQLGRTPSEVALSVMKLVTENTRGHAELEGLSTIDKLNNLRTDPAIEVLQNTDWRGFFESLNQKNISENKQTNGEFDSLYHNNLFQTNNSYRGSKPLPGESLEQTQQRLMKSLEDTSKRMTKRVEILWEELKIPTADRKFYRNSLCRKTTVQQCQELARYIIALKEHRKRTIRALYSISVRETAIRRCVEFMETVTADILAADDRKRRFLKITLRDVQEASYDAINAIKYWRNQLWRPLPFFYHGLDYMNKMLDDTAYFDDQLSCGVLDMSLLGCWHLIGNFDPEAVEKEGENCAESLDEEAEESLFKAPYTPAAELWSCAQYLSEDRLLQRSISIEMKYLTKNKVFIPLIRYGNVAASAENSQVLDNAKLAAANEMMGSSQPLHQGNTFSSDTFRMSMDADTAQANASAADAVDRMSLVDKFRQKITTPSTGKPSSRPTSATTGGDRNRTNSSGSGRPGSRPGSSTGGRHE